MTEERKHAAVGGLVEVVEETQVVGWVDVDPGRTQVQVTLHVNDIEVISTMTVPNPDPETRARAFRFAVLQLWGYTNQNDRVSVRVDGQALRFEGGSLEISPPVVGGESLEALLDMLERGYVFNQKGRLQIAKARDLEWQANVLDLYHRLDAFLQSSFGYEAFLCYGTLLGAVREGTFISRDDDFDAAYVSRHQDGADVSHEFQQIAFALIGAGFQVTGRGSALWVRDYDMGPKVDLFHTFFDAHGHLAFPYGVAGTSTYTRQQFGTLRELPIGDGHGKVPEDAEGLVAHIYGDTWRSPNPGFNWSRDRTNRAVDGILARPGIEEIYWTNFYAHTEFTTASSFCDFVMGQPDLPGVVIDIGCGDGRDSYAFARAGRDVTGLDRAEIGVQHASKKALEVVGGDKARFFACDVAEPGDFRRIVEQVRADHGDVSILFYSRFFLHSITAETQRTMMTVLSEVSRPGDAFAAEFRTDRDALLEKIHGAHYRRYQNAQKFAQALTDRYRFTVVVEQEGNGFSPYNGEDPYLYRVIARPFTPEEVAAADAAAAERVRVAAAAQAVVEARQRTVVEVSFGHRVARKVARDYAPPAATRWARQLKARRRDG